MSTVLQMPKAGLTMVEGTIIEWKTKEGAFVKKGDILMEFENEKTNMQFDSIAEGWLHITAQEGTVVPVGDIIGYIAETETEYQEIIAGIAEVSGIPNEETKVSTGEVDFLEIIMPKAGLTMIEGTIAAWKFREGDRVESGQVLLEFENEKTNMEIESPGDGWLHIAKDVGAVVAVGGALGYIVPTQEEYMTAFGNNSINVNDICAKQCPDCKKGIAVAAAKQNLKDMLAESDSGKIETAISGKRVRSSGLARKIAKNAGVDLSLVTGSGPKGRILGKDVESYLKTVEIAKIEEPQPEMSTDGIQKIKLIGVRKAIAKNMLQSLTEMAQATAIVEVDMTKFMELRARLLECQGMLGTHITVNDVLARATVKALKKHPWMNAIFDGSELTTFDSVHLAVAVGAENGLMVPVVKYADKMDVATLSRAIKDLSERAKEGRLVMGEQSGGTFTITNVGMYPIDAGTPVINPPQVAILGFGRTVKKPVVIDDEIVIRERMNLFLTFDHRVLDGLQVGQMLSEMKNLIENPEMILV